MFLCAAGIAETRRPGEREDIEIEIAGHAGPARARAIGRGRRGLRGLRRHRLFVGAIVENAAAVARLYALREHACRK